MLKIEIGKNLALTVIPTETEIDETREPQFVREGGLQVQVERNREEEIDRMKDEDRGHEVVTGEGQGRGREVQTGRDDALQIGTVIGGDEDDNTFSSRL